MSGIVAYAIRTCLGQAFLGKTLAGERIHDSAVQPIDELIKAAPEPFIVVSTDDEEMEVSPRGWALLDCPRSINVVVETAIGGITRIDLPESEGGGQALRLDVPQTDERLETLLNMLGRQVYREILVGGPWSDLLRDIAFAVTKVTVRRGANTEQGTRFAARQYVFTCDTIAEPDFGEEPEGQFARLLELMAAEPSLSGDVELVRRMIVGEALPDWRRAQVELGLTDASYRALGLGPLFRSEGEPLGTKFTVRQTGRPDVVVEPPAP